MPGFAGIAGSIFAILVFGLIVAIVVKLIVPRIAKFSPSFESVYTAVIAGYLLAFAVVFVLGTIGITQGPGQMLLPIVVYGVIGLSYWKLITGPNGEKLTGLQTVIVLVFQLLIGAIAFGLYYLAGGDMSPFAPRNPQPHKGRTNPMPVHFEIHSHDVEGAKTFYHTVLGWTFDPMPGGEDVDYHLILAPGIGPSQELSGGLMRRMDEMPTPGGPIRGCTLTFEVEDCDATYAAALANGGAEALPPTDYPGIGRCAYIEDGFGNVFGVLALEASD